MEFILNLLTISCFYIAAVWGQRSFIGSPHPGDTLHFNKNFTLQLVRPNGLQSSTEIGIAIGLLSCPVSQGPVCPPPTSQLGTILFTGQFAPTRHTDNTIYENFTLTVPNNDFLSAGRAQLAVVRLHLIGAGPSPVLEINNITVNLGT
ncbi:hypothetical protein DFH06DRAFT_1229077 [Mycena polygramma]|nr:hypothetical protein DFH06DRAFT_1229077 [Mycena polygramma]